MNPRRSRAVPASPAPRVRRASLAQAALAGVGMLAALASGGPVARADEPLWSVDASLDPTLARSLPGAEGMTGAEGVEAPPALCSFDPTVVAPAAPETAQA
ncbi:MAG: hypothetical protein K1X94_30550, partial [Sandaracinaceae bacterium]|nr:hypothetical protein [Sandaracinaceae bacterium]